MKCLLSLFFLQFTFLAFGFAAEQPLKASFYPTAKKDGWRLSLANTSDQKVVLCVEGGTTVSTLRMATGEHYSYSSGPTTLHPLYIAEIENVGGVKSREGVRGIDSLRNLKLALPPQGIVLQPGDRLTLSDGVYPKLPVRTTVKVAIYTSSGWDEIVLNWIKPKR